MATITKIKKPKYFIKFRTNTEKGLPVSVELPLKKTAKYKEAEQYCETTQTCTMDSYMDFYKVRSLTSTSNVVSYYWCEPYLPEELKEYVDIPTNTLVRYDRKDNVIRVACNK